LLWQGRKNVWDTETVDTKDQGKVAEAKKINGGVTMTSSSGHPYYVANYNRPIIPPRDKDEEDKERR
jgi:hypothetical protein